MPERRPALDGLRAVAVVAVVLYHLRAPWLPGGFLGVDLFFVLSGYLITGLLLRDAERGPLDLAAFWVRRARRLLPALVVMLGAVLVAIRLWEPAPLWRVRQGDALAALFYYANWHDIGAAHSYFDDTAAPSPLRHMWSLAVEEQWYLLWPLVLAALIALRLSRPTVVALLCAATAASAVTMAVLYDPADPIRSYAGTDARAQQLLIGALLVLLTRRYPGGAAPAARLAPAAAAAGLVLLLTVRDSGDFYYRGGATLTAAVCALLIWCAERAPGTRLVRLLATGPLRGLGRISYGVYLWHIPAIAFAPHLLPGVPAPAAAVVLTLGPALLSYHLVERPVRAGRPRFACRTTGRFVTSAAAAVAACALLATAVTTRPDGRQSEQLAAADRAVFGGAADGAAVGGPAAAMARTGDPSAPPPAEAGLCPDTTSLCERAPARPGQRTAAVVGDSVARSLDPGIADLAARKGWGYILAAHNGCGLTGLVSVDPGSGRAKPFMQQCAEQTPGRIRQLLADYRPGLVIAYSRWENFAHLGTDGRPVAPPSARWATDVHDGLRAFAETVVHSGATLVLISVLPAAPADPACLTHPDGRGCGAAPDETTAAVNRIYARIRDEVPGVKLVSLQDALCPDGRCRAVVDGLLVRFDGLHFSADGARWFAQRLEPLLP
ncbi:acyltransferase family protein [Dactylosporangium sp. CA-092794]|uniref:acyltransferase family protein n=1 Tax=Dactylosporangium sp. CA-092794 TaxID=3239929 RepID=UPI003D92072F